VQALVQRMAEGTAKIGVNDKIANIAIALTFTCSRCAFSIQNFASSIGDANKLSQNKTSIIIG
jgi:hypothetical protein